MKKNLGLYAGVAMVLSLGLLGCDDEEAAAVRTADFVVQLSGSSEVPPVETSATGVAYIDVDTASMTVTVDVETTGMVPTAAHLHDNFAGANGPVLFGLTQDADDSTKFSGETTFTAAQIMKLNDGGIYVNVHSSEVPSGELRGQALGGDVELITFPLQGSQENPPVSTEHSGSVTITKIGDDGFELRATHDVDNATAAHIHSGAVGSNGSVVVALTISGSNLTGSFTGAAFSDTLKTGLENGGLYVNLHSGTVGSGELRGQIQQGAPELNDEVSAVQ